MSDLLSVYDRNVKKIGVLQNAYSISETQELNQIYNLTFSMPYDDPKTDFIKPFNYVRWTDDGELYRVVKSKSDNTETGSISYECEHAIATLCDTALFTTITGPVTLGGTNVHTREVIETLLAKQTTVLWKLGQCEFDFQFEYSWEQENLLNALFSIPKDFVKPYRWVYDTTTTPWKVHLLEIDTSVKPEYYIRASRNLIDSNSDTDYTDICTRLYPIGYGEGVNQLNISEVNNGKPYLEASSDIINRYGIIEKVLVDRSFENAEPLKKHGEKVLSSLTEPKVSRSFNVVDLYPLTNNEIDKAKVGKICRLTMDDLTVYITKTIRVLDDPGNLQIELSTKATDAVSTIADLAERVRIESVYAQGATQLYQHSKDANATPDKGFILSLYFPEEMRQINKVLLNVQLDRFRSYSTTTEDGGGTTNTSVNSGGGGISLGSVELKTDVNIDTLNIEVEKTSDAQWEIASDIVTHKTKVGNNDTDVLIATSTYSSHNHKVYGYTGEVTPPASDEFKHDHAINFTTDADDEYGVGGRHQHVVYQTDYSEGHSHAIDRDELKHYHSASGTGKGKGTGTAKVPVNNSETGQSGFSHSHTVNLPKHKHDILPGIFEASESPSSFSILVNNVVVHTENSTSYNGNITNFLLTNGQIPRNSWIKVEIKPNVLAYVISSVFIQGFVQSRGGGNY